MTPTKAPQSPRHDTLRPVPSKGSERVSIRMPDSTLWDEFGQATDDQAKDRSVVLRDFMRWYLRKPDAELPERPEGQRP